MTGPIICIAVGLILFIGLLVYATWWLLSLSAAMQEHIDQQGKPDLVWPVREQNS